MLKTHPTKSEIETIIHWDILNLGVSDLIELIEDVWSKDYGRFIRRGRRVLQLELHTGGWSDNESIIEALKNNTLFWCSFWRKSVVGGHYYFKIDTKTFKSRKD